MTEKVLTQSNRLITVPSTANIAIRSSIDMRKILKKTIFRYPSNTELVRACNTRREKKTTRCILSMNKTFLLYFYQPPPVADGGTKLDVEVSARLFDTGEICS